MLSSNQVSRFETLGFLVIPQLFSRQEISAITKEADAVWESTQGRATDPGHTEEGKQIFGFVERNPLLTSLPADDRIFGAVEQLLGPDFLYLASDGNMWAGDTVWHSDDNIRPGYKRVKVALYLDPLTQENGCLRVIPGSHRHPMHGDLDFACKENISDPLGIPSVEFPSFPVETNPGDVLMFCHDIFHASFGSPQIRRQIALNFFAKPEVEHISKWVKALYSDIRDMSDEKSAAAFLNNPNPNIQKFTSGLKKLGIK